MSSLRFAFLKVSVSTSFLFPYATLKTDMETTSTWNYYQVLDIATDAEQEAIYQAYLQAKATYFLTNANLFQTFTPQEAVAWLEVIEEAYSILGHPNTRKIYDKEIETIANPEDDLPSFNYGANDEAKPQDDEKQTPLVIPEENLSSDMGRTPLSTYSIDKNMEELIAKQDIFDGLFLRKIRNYKKVDLQAFSNSTCIALRHLYAIENNNFSVLPAAVFVRGYIIQYCRILDLPEDKVLNSFMSLLRNG